MDKEKKNLLVFGYGLTAILLFAGARVWIRHYDALIALVLGLAAVVVLLITMFNRPLLKSFYLRWMKVAHFIGMIASGIILAVLFFCVFGVIGIILRIMRRDLLDQKIELAETSYWHKRSLQPFSEDQYKKQF